MELTAARCNDAGDDEWLYEHEGIEQWETYNAAVQLWVDGDAEGAHRFAAAAAARDPRPDVRAALQQLAARAGGGSMHVCWLSDFACDASSRTRMPAPRSAGDVLSGAARAAAEADRSRGADHDAQRATLAAAIAKRRTEHRSHVTACATAAAPNAECWPPADVGTAELPSKVAEQAPDASVTAAPLRDKAAAVCDVVLQRSRDERWLPWGLALNPVTMVFEYVSKDSVAERTRGMHVCCGMMLCCVNDVPVESIAAVRDEMEDSTRVALRFRPVAAAVPRAHTATDPASGELLIMAAQYAALLRSGAGPPPAAQLY